MSCGSDVLRHIHISSQGDTNGDTIVPLDAFGVSRDSARKNRLSSPVDFGRFASTRENRLHRCASRHVVTVWMLPTAGILNLMA